MVQLELPEALLQAVAAAPDDDAPRLVAADWFAEHGDAARAELIQLQCAFEALHPASPLREPLEVRIRALVQFAPPMMELVRGFPQLVVGDDDDVAEAAPGLASMPLVIDRLRLSLVDLGGLNRLVKTPFWSAIRWLQLDELDDASASALFDSPAMERVEHLVIDRCEDLSRHSWQLLARSPALARLVSLRLRNPPAAHWVKAKPVLPALRLLDLERGGLSPDELKALSHTPVWEQLQTLELISSPIATEGAAVFAERAPPALEALNLSWCKVSQAGVRSLARMNAHLKILKLRHATVGGATLAPLLDAPCTMGLEWLDVRGNQIDPRTVGQLVERFGKRLLYDR